MDDADVDDKLSFGVVIPVKDADVKVPVSSDVVFSVKTGDVDDSVEPKLVFSVEGIEVENPVSFELVLSMEVVALVTSPSSKLELSITEIVIEVPVSFGLLISVEEVVEVDEPPSSSSEDVDVGPVGSSDVVSVIDEVGVAMLVDSERSMEVVVEAGSVDVQNLVVKIVLSVELRSLVDVFETSENVEDNTSTSSEEVADD